MAVSVSSCDDCCCASSVPRAGCMRRRPRAIAECGEHPPPSRPVPRSQRPACPTHWRSRRRGSAAARSICRSTPASRCCCGSGRPLEDVQPRSPFGRSGTAAVGRQGAVRRRCLVRRRSLRSRDSSTSTRLTFPQISDDDGKVFARFDVPYQPAMAVIDKAGVVQVSLGAVEEGRARRSTDRSRQRLTVSWSRSRRRDWCSPRR